MSAAIKTLSNTTNIVIVDREVDSIDPFIFESNTSGARLDISENAGASTEYLRRMATRVSNTFNSVAFKEAMGQDTYVKFHREGDAPTNLVMPSLTSRTVTVNMKDPYGTNTMPVKATSYAGETIVSKPSNISMLISMVHEKFDYECDGNITELTMQQEMQQVMLQLDREITSKLVQALEEQDADGTKYFTKQEVPALPVGPILEAYESIEGGIYGAIRSMSQFGNQIDDFILGVSPAVYGVMERAARRTGHNSVECFVGTDVYQYIPKADSGTAEMFIMPKAMVAVSFREAADGTVIEPIVTRNPSKQSTTMELVGIADLICDGFTTVKTQVGGSVQQVDVKLPVITKVVFDGS